ncbi:MAG: MFS transporter [Chlamydiales bacterium]
MNYIKKTKKAILWTNVLNGPLISICALFAIILRKDVHISPFQIILFGMLKPIVSIFSFYWSSWIKNHPTNLRCNLILAGIALRIPFLLFPFVNQGWFYIASGILYILLNRTLNPIWIEVLKRNLSKEIRDRYYSIGSSINCLMYVLLAIIFGKALDILWFRWQWIFFGSALLGLFGLFFQVFLPIQNSTYVSDPKTNLSWKSFLTLPWVNSFRLMKERRDFAKFQWIFMLGGSALMLVQPIIPLLLVDILNLSYMDMTIAFMICEGLGFCLSTSAWARALNKYPIYFVISLVCALFAVYIMCIFSVISFPLISFPSAIYIAYIIYGIASAGSHLAWNLSGAIFAKDESSMQFSSVNVVMVGIRGLIVHPLSGYLYFKLGLGAPSVFCLAIFICIIGTIYAYSLLVSKKVSQI